MCLCRLSLILALGFLTANGIAQQADPLRIEHIVGLHFGINQIKEENLHPKVSTGTITGLSYEFEKTKKAWHQFHFTLAYSRVKTQLEDLSKTLNLQLHTGYSWNYPLVNKNRFRYFLGPEGTIAYNVSFYPNWDDSHLYWADYYSLGVRNSFLFDFKNENELAAFVSLPLFSVFSRPELYRLYKIDDTDFGGIMQNLNSNMTAAHLVNVFYLSLQAEYRFPVFKNKRQAFLYAFQFNRMKHEGGNTFSQLSHKLGIKIFL